MNEEDFRELDLLCGNLQCENTELKEKNKFLEAECSAMRDQIRYLEKNMYNEK